MRSLIVDDELVSRKKLLNIMDSFGQCVAVENGEDALRVATSQDPPDLILLDVSMPGMGGYEVCKRLKANRRTSNIPVIFVSVRSGEDDEAEGLGLGAVDYITKPFSPSIVKARVRTHLELKKHRDRLEELVNERTVELEKATKEMQAEIAERKQSEEALRESEERYRRLAENSPDMIYQMSLPDGKYEYVSPAVARIFGYPPEAWYENPCLIREIIHPDWHSYFETEWENLLNGHVPPTYEYKIIHKDKSVRWINQRNILVKGDNGSPVAIEGILSDITESKRAEEALRGSEEKFKNLFDNMNSGVAVYTAENNGKDFIFHDLNKAVEQIEKISKEKIIGRSVLEMFPAVKVFGLFDVLQRVWKTGKPEHHLIAVYKDERITGWRDNFVYKLPSGEIVAVYSDETKRKQAEEALRQAYNIINRSPTVVFVWKNAEGWPVEFVSDNVVELFGHTAEEFTSGKVSYATTVHPDDLERVAQEVITYSKEEDRKEFSHDPYRIITKNGEIKWLDDMSSIRRDEKGDITHYEGIVLDISDKKQAEIEKGRLQSQLQQSQKMEADWDTGRGDCP